MKRPSSGLSDLLIAAVRNNNPEVAELLIQQGADVNLRDPLAAALATLPNPIPVPVQPVAGLPQKSAATMVFSAATTRAIIAPEPAVFSKKTTPAGFMR